MKWLRLLACSLLWAIPLYLGLWRLAGVWLDLWRPPWWAYLCSAYLIDWAFVVAGFAVVAYLAKKGARTVKIAESVAGRGEILTWAPDWAAPWGNLDEGINPLTEPTNASGRRWWAASRTWSWFRQTFSWSALRNPASGLRFSKWFGVQLDVERVIWVGNSLNPARDWRDREDARSPSMARIRAAIESVGADGIAALMRRRVFWIFAAQGFKAGLWIVNAKSGRTTQLGWRVFIFDWASDREIERYHSLKLQVLRKP